MRTSLYLVTGLLAAQSATFDVTSIHPAAAPPPEGGAGHTISTSPAGVTARSSTFRDCIEWAYGLRSYQLTGPDWIDSERFDVVGRTAVPVTRDQQRAMLRRLVAERFGLQAHWEQRQLPVWALTVAKQVKTLQPSKFDAASMSKLPGGGLRLEFHRTSMADLAGFLSSLAAIDRPVRDASGLAGVYDFKLDLHEVAGPWGSEAERLAAPSMSTVLREQLGLRLESRKDAVEVLVVDRVERPTPN